MLDLPRPVPPHDAHTHTTFSDGRNTVAEMVQAAEAVGLEALAITDHVRPDTTDLDRHIAEIERVGEGSPVVVLPGAEAPIMDTTGRLGIGPSQVESLSLVLAEFNGGTEGVATNIPASSTRLLDNIFDALEAVVAGGLVRALAHPFNLGRFDAAVYPEELPRSRLRQLARLMVEHSVAFEIMNHMCWWFPHMPVDEFTRQYARVLRVFGEENCKFVVGSDSHCVHGVGNTWWSRRVMRVAGVELSQVVDLRALA
ncbi:MAG: PHP domain-containing protein [Armatimonadetes bacterium]|nr:PHP domain-containing protein [Armatimonadota bacterium]